MHSCFVASRLMITRMSQVCVYEEWFLLRLAWEATLKTLKACAHPRHGAILSAASFSGFREWPWKGEVHAGLFATGRKWPPQTRCSRFVFGVVALTPAGWLVGQPVTGPQRACPNCHTNEGNSLDYDGNWRSVTMQMGSFVSASPSFAPHRQRRYCSRSWMYIATLLSKRVCQKRRQSGLWSGVLPGVPSHRLLGSYFVCILAKKRARLSDHLESSYTPGALS